MEQQSKAYYNCSVYGCLNSTLNSEYSFFKVPAVLEKRNKWLRLMHREDLIDSSRSRPRVCEAHFSPSSISTYSSRKLLKQNSIPQLLLPTNNFESKGIQTTSIERVNANSQCDYNLMTNAQVQTPLYLLNDTPGKRILLSEIQRFRKRIKLEDDTQSSEANTFNKLCDKFLTPNLARVVKQQTKIKTDGHGFGNRYNLDYKIFCLNLYYVSPQAYSMLKDTLCLPSKQTLMKMYMPITTKIYSHLMDVLKTKVQFMSDMDRNCALVIDAISLKTNLFYNIKEDKVYGFHEVDGEQSPEPAKYALVAMIHGLNENYVQPVGFALLAECKKHPSITDWIDNVILELFSIGFHVRSLVSDMSSDFFNCARKRSVSAESPFFFVGGRKIYYIFDPPHLIKYVRNILIDYEFHFDNDVAKWHHILEFYEMDKLKRFRLAPKLTDSHIKPTKLERREIKYAVQVLSATVAAGLSTYRDFGVIENSAKGTVKLIEIMNDLFDIFNASSRYGSKQYQNAFCGEEFQIAYVNSMLNFFESLKLINPKNGQNVTSKVKFIEGFQITLKSLLMLFEDLRIEGFSYVLTKRLSLDCLENFLGQIRTKKGNSTEPTSRQLVSAFRKKFFKNILMWPKSGNCTEDLTKCLLDAEKLLDPLANEPGDSETTSIMVTKESNSCAKIYLISTTDYNTLDLPEKDALVYVSEYLLKKCLHHHNECNELIAYTEGEDIAPEFLEFVRSMEERFCNFFKRNYLNCEILKNLLNEIETITFSMPCKCFPLTYCKQLYLRMRIYYTLKSNNRAFRQCQNRCKLFSVTNL